MEIGSFVNPRQLSALKGGGADYAEFNLVRALLVDGAPSFVSLGAELSTLHLPVYSFSGLVADSTPLIGPDVDRDREDEYLTEMLAQCASISGKHSTFVFGSGGARSVPQGFSRTAALDQLEDFLRRAAAIAATNGFRLAFEALHPGETNLINSLHEAGRYLREWEIPNLFLVADLFHMNQVDEPLSVIDAFADLIVHAHVADTERRPPGLGSYPLEEFFRALRVNGYTGRCSIECRWNDFDAQVGPAIAACRNAVLLAER